MLANNISYTNRKYTLHAKFGVNEWTFNQR